MRSLLLEMCERNHTRTIVINKRLNSAVKLEENAFKANSSNQCTFNYISTIQSLILGSARKTIFCKLIHMHKGFHGMSDCKDFFMWLRRLVKDFEFHIFYKYLYPHKLSVFVIGHKHVPIRHSLYDPRHEISNNVV